ncbi:phosphoglycerate mutase [Sanghuangporus baumii]|uniref:Phosphoglycerate mutase n=1 Tax=Sanghuangporus baumii TaxID=108892 RepID=A0A9Q5N923_SANBA|nr:phosphoglycerate mutase [Sanghuangporus baumii]
MPLTINFLPGFPVPIMPGRVYESVTGFFIQDEGYDSSIAIPPRFGLLDATEHRWSNTIHRLEELNKKAEPGVAYKLIIAGRHGQGFHNVGELKYGTERWNAYWAKIDGDGEIVWGPDPLLTDLGEEQARDANAVWFQERAAGLPSPDRLYCSPMTRALRTCELTFANLVDFSDQHPLILENAREIYGVHPCDMRRSRSYIRAEFPAFDIEEDFTEEDQLYDPNVRETYTHVAKRAHSVLDRIFEDNKGSLTSITAHSGFIRGLVATTKHATAELPTGGVLPMVVKGTVVEQ